MRSCAEGLAESFLDRIPVGRHVDLFQQMYERYDGFKVHRVEKSAEYEIAVLLERENVGEWRNLRIETESTAPHRIKTIDYHRAGRPDDIAPPKKLSEAEIITALESSIRKRVERDQFSGTVLVA